MVKTIEILVRDILARPGRTRPGHRMVGHTQLLTTALRGGDEIPCEDPGSEDGHGDAGEEE